MSRSKKSQVSKYCKAQVSRALKKSKSKSKKSRSRSRSRKQSPKMARLAYLRKNYASTVGSDGKKYFMVPEPIIAPKKAKSPKTFPQFRPSPMSMSMASPVASPASGFGSAYSNSWQPLFKMPQKSVPSCALAGGACASEEDV